jgi:hypothetical protein
MKVSIDIKYDSYIYTMKGGDRLKAISVRVPVSLHSYLHKEAIKEGISLNQLCLTKLSIPLAYFAKRSSGEKERKKEN